jgi:hypothetical protein
MATSPPPAPVTVVAVPAVTAPALAPVTPTVTSTGLRAPQPWLQPEDTEEAPPGKQLTKAQQKALEKKAEKAAMQKAKAAVGPLAGVPV